VATSSGGLHGLRRQTVVHERLRELLAEQLEAGLREGMVRPRGRAIPPALLARHVAATFVLVLEWWAADGMQLPVREVDVCFHALVRPALVDARRPTTATNASD
jgi:hypothetical protein